MYQIPPKDYLKNHPKNYSKNHFVYPYLLFLDGKIKNMQFQSKETKSFLKLKSVSSFTYPSKKNYQDNLYNKTQYDTLNIQKVNVIQHPE